MLKNEKGVTLMILVVTIIVIIILAGVVMNINMSLNKSVELKEVLANMEIIRTAATPYRDKYIEDTIVSEDEEKNKTYTISDKFIGVHMDPKTSEINELLNYSQKDTISEAAQYWFKLNKENLEKLNVNISIDNGDIYFINYNDLEVGYCKEQKDDNNRHIGIKARKRFGDGSSSDPVKEKYVYFYSILKDVKTREMRK